MKDLVRASQTRKILFFRKGLSSFSFILLVIRVTTKKKGSQWKVNQFQMSICSLRRFISSWKILNQIKVEDDVPKETIQQEPNKEVSFWSQLIVFWRLVLLHLKESALCKIGKIFHPKQLTKLKEELIFLLTKMWRQFWILHCWAKRILRKFSHTKSLQCPYSFLD